MALFGRGRRDAPREEPESPVLDPLGASADAAPEVAEPVPEVGISLSTYGKPAGRPAATPPAPADPAALGAGRDARPAPGAPGLPDNAVLRAALAALPEKPDNADVLNVMRQALQGTLYLRVRGNAKQLIAENKELPLAVASIEDQRFLLAFTGGGALQDSIRADNGATTSAVGQPVMNVLRNVLAGPYAGLIIDQASARARIVLPRELIQTSVDQADPALAIKNLLSTPRTDRTAALVVEALTTTKTWVAVGPADEDGRRGIAEVRTADGERRLEVFSHPLEVLALGRGDQPAPVDPEQLARAVAGDPGIVGLIVDPAGPWLQIERAQLTPLLDRV
ncbi:SseB family protein [Microbacterium sp.]|uniref:SseB family protein n=1 Tax=Microbacterium sp. TaxID=51671 RepID=UPI003A880BCA